MYKVLRKKGGRLISCVISKKVFSWSNWWTVRYIPQTWVRARKGKLFVCKSLRDARRFCASEYGHEIWRCQTKNVKEFPYVSRLYKEMFKEFWENNDGGFEKFIPKIPTYGADAVKLTKKVWPSDKRK